MLLSGVSNHDLCLICCREHPIVLFKIITEIYLLCGMDKVVISVSIVLQLTFFSSLKKMRKLNEKLMNEISSQPNDMDVS